MKQVCVYVCLLIYSETQTVLTVEHKLKVVLRLKSLFSLNLAVGELSILAT